MNLDPKLLLKKY